MGLGKAEEYKEVSEEATRSRKGQTALPLILPSSFSFPFVLCRFLDILSDLLLSLSSRDNSAFSVCVFLSLLL